MLQPGTKKVCNCWTTLKCASGTVKDDSAMCMERLLYVPCALMTILMKLERCKTLFSLQLVSAPTVVRSILPITDVRQRHLLPPNRQLQMAVERYENGARVRLCRPRLTVQQRWQVNAQVTRL